MPGPLTAPTFDLAKAWRQYKHPIYNATGEKVGSYTSLDAACQGQWLKFTGVAQPPPSQLYVRDFWARPVPLSTQCTRAAVATAQGGILAKITQPQPVQPAAAARAVREANQAATGSPEMPTIDAPFFPEAGQIDPSTINRWALYGGLGLVGLLLLTTPSRGRR